MLQGKCKVGKLNKAYHNTHFIFWSKRILGGAAGEQRGACRGGGDDGRGAWDLQRWWKMGRGVGFALEKWNALKFILRSIHDSTYTLNAAELHALNGMCTRWLHGVRTVWSRRSKEGERDVRLWENLTSCAWLTLVWLTLLQSWSLLFFLHGMWVSTVLWHLWAKKNGKNFGSWAL